ncbi:type II secretion system F family protein [Pararoseomonas indoligenes]|uniref:Type II secretion system F family protein n=1 Tax=Roseomonas indoligenes TaxID=2820811 RepID=A0A940S895_9PROT|nr:type II secretion system F family protein [Pararoseomonas indoligenes]MBP0493872.1 type II secretion system F family protein [Pararoseomonas indoligenes]
MPTVPLGWLMSLFAVAGAMGLALTAAVLLARSAEERDLSRRLRSVLSSGEGRARQVRTTPRASPWQLFRRLGNRMHESALVSEKEMKEFQRAVAAAGLDANQAVPIFLGMKAVLIVVAPLGGLALALFLALDGMRIGLSVFAGIAVAIYVPNIIMSRLRKPFQESLRRGLPDAMDLMVVAAEAGLGLETAIERVAREMAGTNRAIAIEMNVLVQEMRMMPDRQAALERLGERTDVEGFKRLATTLAQTLRYGTPLAQALRILAAEMRQERMLRIEEKAIRLPALLVGPLILFILPALFIALIGPSIIEMGRSFGTGQ